MDRLLPILGQAPTPAPLDTSRSMTMAIDHTFRRLPIFGMAVATLMATAVTAAEPVRLEFPSQSPGVPAYARLELLIPGFDVPMTPRWSAIVFYRDPACVPPDFDLGRFFHLPGPGGPGAFGCELLVEGHELWANGPGQDAAPMYAFSRNASPNMPVWFVSTAELLPLLDSGAVTIKQLQALPSLRKGVAWHYSESLYPNGSAPSPGITLRADGRLEAINRGTPGQQFKLRWHYHAARGEDEVVIKFHGPSSR
jgi:hypothetical protein